MNREDIFEKEIQPDTKLEIQRVRKNTGKGDLQVYMCWRR